MDKQAYEMTSEEFYQVFPLFTECSPRTKWRLYRICNKVNLEETGESGTYEEFIEAAVEFRWDIENATVLWHDNHKEFVAEALSRGDDIPSDVLAEYPDLVEEYINKRVKSKRLQVKRRERMIVEKAESKMSKEDKAFWSQFK